MTNVVGVRFRKTGKIYYFDGQELELSEGYVIVETVNGTECGELVFAQREIEDEKLMLPLNKVIRQATPADEKKLSEREQKKADALEICGQRVAAHGLDMKLIDVDIAFDGEKITFYFTADGRVDFRELVKDLAHIFRTRIDLRQIGVRDEMKMMGGIGACGRKCCCSAFLREFVPVSIKMAKEQGLSLNPTKISGQCGRLMCCLKYEQSYYEETRKEMPRIGREVKTPDGPGMVLDCNVIRKTCRARITLPDQTVDVRTYTLDEISRAEAGLPPIEKKKKEDDYTLSASEFVEGGDQEKKYKKPQRSRAEQPEGNADNQKSAENQNRRRPPRRRPDQADRAKPAEQEQKNTPEQKSERQQRQPRQNRPRQDGAQPRQNAQRQTKRTEETDTVQQVTLRPAGKPQQTQSQTGDGQQRRRPNQRRRPRPQQNRQKSAEGEEIIRLVPAERRKSDE